MRPRSSPDPAPITPATNCPPRSRSSTTRPPPSLFAVTAPTGTAARRSPGGSPATRSWSRSSEHPAGTDRASPGSTEGRRTASSDTGLVVGRKYEYRVIGVDEAANRAEQKLSLVATGALLSPTPGLPITVKSPPTLVWAPVEGRVLLQHPTDSRGRKVLSAWPERPSFRLRRTWLYKGRRYPTPARRLPLVRLARIWADLGRPVREAPARKQLVRRDEVGRRVRRHAAVFLLAVVALLLTPGAAGLPNVPGDPTPPVVTPVITGTLGAAGLVHDQRHRQLVGDGPGVDHPLDDGLQHGHASRANTTGTPLTLLGRERRRHDDRREDVQGRQDCAGDDRDSLPRPPTRTAGTTTSSRVDFDGQRHHLRPRVVLAGRGVRRA